MSALPPIADTCSAQADVCFVPKADMCGATRDVRFVPIADIAVFIRSPRQQLRAAIAGIVRPSALAVLRLTVSSTFVDCWTGKSAGFSPLRMRPV